MNIERANKPSNKLPNKRLLIVVPSLGHGGAERVAVELATRFSTQNFEVHLVTVATADNDFFKLPNSVRRHALGLESESHGTLSAIAANFRRVSALRRVIKNINPDTIFSLTGRANVTTIIAAITSKARVVVSERTHPPMIPLGRIWDLLRKITYQRADMVTAQTELAAQWLKTNTFATSVDVIPNAVWHNPKQDGRVLAPVDYVENDNNLLLAVGRLDPQKGFDFLVSAFEKLSSAHPNWCLVILGEGPMRAKLEQMAQHLNIQLPGTVGNTQQWYQRADLFVLSSRMEGFPNVLLEALASGTPAVAFNCPAGVSDLISDEHNGLLVPPKDINALSNALDRAMTDDQLRLSLASNTINSIQKYDEPYIVQMWQDILFP